MRLLREAKSAAALDHPFICHIHEVGEVEGKSFIAMEYVQGMTLQDKLARGPLPIREAVGIAAEIAEALEAAHKQSLVHRDLKPSNIMLTPEGHVKVMDFGLAKRVTPVESQDGEEITTKLTKDDSILGTVPYMSPEQLRGQEVDARSDIFSFGVVLYEMLAGVHPFRKRGQIETANAILSETAPPLSRYTEGIPVLLQHTVKKMLAKEPDRRYQLIHEVKTDLVELAEESGDSVKVIETAASAAGGWRQTIPLAAALLLGALIAGFTVWNFRPSPDPETRSVSRLVVPLPSDVRVVTRELVPLVLSPDGNRLAFVGRQGGVNQLYLRSMESLETKALPGTEEASLPFFSPNGQWIGFFAGRQMKKISVGGGAPVVLCDIASGRGGSWAENGSIVFTPQSRGAGLSRVSAEGGTPQPVTTLDSSKGETSHRYPHLLPGGEAVLFTAYGATYADVTIIGQWLETGEQRVLVEGGSQSYYSPTGHLIYVQPEMAGTVMAVPFDPERLELTGSPAPVVEGVASVRGDTAVWSVSRQGMLIYVPSGAERAEDRLVWVDREGEAEPLPLEPGPYRFPQLSPDGRQVVVGLEGPQSTLWIYDLVEDTFNRLTFEGNNSWPLWTPDGRRVAFASLRAGGWSLFWKAADGTGEEELLLAEARPRSFSPDGKALLFAHNDPTTAQDVWVLTLDDERRAEPLLQTPAVEMDARFSPNGRFLAYASDESGQNEVYVRPFPNLEGGKWQISTEGGREPVWAHSGRELFYRSGEKMMIVDIRIQPAFRSGTPRQLFEGPYLRAPTPTMAHYDITSNDRRFLMVQEGVQEGEASQINVVLNWFEELKRLVPTE